MIFVDSFFDELQKFAQDWTVEEIHALADELGVKWDNDPSFMAFCKEVVGKEHLDSMSRSELSEVAAALIDRRESSLGERRKAQGATPTKLKPITLKKKKASDIVRAANRKKMLLGVKREKAILKVDIMRRIRKKLRLALKPFLKLKKQQRAMRIGMVQKTRALARKSYKR